MPMEIKPKQSPGWLRPEEKVALLITTAIGAGLVVGLWLAPAVYG